jgi:signal transduction histidine kinase
VSRLRRLLPRRPRTLTWQVISLLLLALVTAQLATFAILSGERRSAVEAFAREQVLERAAALVRLVETTESASERRRALRAFSTSQLRFWLADEPAVDAADSARPGPLARRLGALLGDGQPREVFIAFGDIERHGDDRRSRWHDHWRRAAARGEAHGAPPPRLPDAGLLLAINLVAGEHTQTSVPGNDDRWLNAAMLLPPARPALGPAPLIALVVAAVAISLVAAFSLRRLTRPLDALAVAADAVGRGEPARLQAVRGPLEIRRTAAAFNEMQERIARSMGDRTRLLAAISHDLRTPITSLRLRAELVEDDDLRERMLATLDEMQALTEAGLLLARDTAAEEPSRSIDLVALIESLAADLVDQGHDVRLEPGPAARLRCRKLALTRAVRNLLENALRYGGNAVMRIVAAQGSIDILIEDDGPGLPEAALEQVFEPFFRLETSRSRETGGSGLGLAIARSIIREHGGEVTLANRPEGGLRATIRLPTGASGDGDGSDI